MHLKRDSMKEEIFEIVNGEDEVIGCAPRKECHGNPSLTHRVAHVLVHNTAGELLLQKRSQSKFIQPGRWDTSVGGHLEPGEGYEQAALRELNEELGITDVPVRFLRKYFMRNEIESECVATFLVQWEGQVHFNEAEIEEVRFFSTDEIEKKIGSGAFTPNFEKEYRYLHQHDILKIFKIG